MAEEKVGCGKPDCVPCAIAELAVKKFPHGSVVTDGKAEWEFVDQIMFGLLYFIGKVPSQQLQDYLINHVIEGTPKMFPKIQEMIMEEDQERSVH